MKPGSKHASGGTSRGFLPTRGQSASSLPGFSLVEVVMAVSIIALAIPTMLGVFGVFARLSSDTLDREEASAAVSAIQSYLENDAGNAANPGAASFATVYGWVHAARQDPGSASVLYAYKDIGNDSDFTVSVDPPDEGGTARPVEGRILVVEILAPGETLLPDSVLVANASEYSKAYLPLKIDIHAVSISAEERSSANFVDSYPMVLLR